MKFYVSRTSLMFDEEQPCEGAILLNPDYDKTEDSPIWGIEINDLDELIKFKREYGSIIIKRTYNNPEYSELEIEIYDDFRE